LNRYWAIKFLRDWLLLGAKNLNVNNYFTLASSYRETGAFTELLGVKNIIETALNNKTCHSIPY
jgi:hypothetical protein